MILIADEYIVCNLGGDSVYADAKLINEVYRTINGKKYSSIKNLIKQLQIDDVIYIQVINREKPITFMDKFKRILNIKSKKPCISVFELQEPKEGKYKQDHLRLLQMITNNRG